MILRNCERINLTDIENHARSNYLIVPGSGVFLNFLKFVIGELILNEKKKC